MAGPGLWLNDGTAKLALNAEPDTPWRLYRGNILAQNGKTLLPALQGGFYCRILACRSLQFPSLGCVKNSQRIFRAAQFVVVAGGGAHCSRHSLSFCKLRRIQLFIVPSGTHNLVASSL